MKTFLLASLAVVGAALSTPQAQASDHHDHHWHHGHSHHYYGYGYAPRVYVTHGYYHPVRHYYYSDYPGYYGSGYYGSGYYGYNYPRYHHNSVSLHFGF